jgi:WD40 repeat protein
VFDGTVGIERFVSEFDEVVGCMAPSPDGMALAAALTDPSRGTTKVVLLDSISGERLATLPTQKKGCTALLFAADGHHLAVGFNGFVQLWDIRTRELEKTITGFERVVSCLAYTSNGKLLAAGTQDGQVWIDVGSRGVRCIGFSPDCKRLVTVANNAPVGLWNVAEITSESAELQ